MAKSIGQGGSITVSATQYPVTEWSISVNNDTQDTTDTGSGGWQEMLAGIDSSEVTFTAFWGSAVALLSTVFAIGSTITATMVIGATGKSFSGSFLVKTFSVKNNAKSPIEFSCTLTSTGATTMPA